MYGAFIASVSVGSGGASSIQFTSIPQTYTDLVLVLSGRSSTAYVTDDVYITINGSTSSISGKRLYGTGSTTSTTSITNSIGYMSGSSATASTFGNGVIYFANYAGGTNKPFSSDMVSESAVTNPVYQSIFGSLLSSTSAITSISVAPSVSWSQYSTAYLYGLKSGSGGATVS